MEPFTGAGPKETVDCAPFEPSPYWDKFKCITFPAVHRHVFPFFPLRGGLLFSHPVDALFLPQACESGPGNALLRDYSV